MKNYLNIQLEEMEKKAGNAEGEVSGLRSRLILLQVYPGIGLYPTLGIPRYRTVYYFRYTQA